MDRLPAAAALDRSAYRMHAFAYPIWTFAVIAGAIWAENAWGRYWGWDPKETWAFITWMVYTAYLHARATAGWQGRKAAYVGAARLRDVPVQLPGREHLAGRLPLLRRRRLSDPLALRHGWSGATPCATADTVSSACRCADVASVSGRSASAECLSGSGVGRAVRAAGRRTAAAAGALGRAGRRRRGWPAGRPRRGQPAGASGGGCGLRRAVGRRPRRKSGSSSGASGRRPPGRAGPAARREQPGEAAGPRLPASSQASGSDDRDEHDEQRPRRAWAGPGRPRRRSGPGRRARRPPG